MTMLVRVDPRYPGVWDDLVGYLADGLDYGGGSKDWDAGDIYDAACKGAVALWAIISHERVIGSVVTTMTTYPRRQVLEVLVMGADRGSEPHWRECLSQLADLARASGASAIIGTGRPGWARKLGAEERRVFELPITEDTEA